MLRQTRELSRSSSLRRPREFLGDDLEEFKGEIELVKGASHEFDKAAYLAGELTPVYFGTALRNFGVNQMLDGFVDYAPAPLSRATTSDVVDSKSDEFTGFVFKIQANMDPKHRDRIAFMRVCSGQYSQGMKMRHVRIGKEIRVSDAVTFLAGERSAAEEAYLGRHHWPAQPRDHPNWRHVYQR